MAQGEVLANQAFDRYVDRLGKALATLMGKVSDYCWQLWSAKIKVTAQTEKLLLRAFDSSGGFMPQRVPWNAKGYLQNSWYRLPISVS